MDLQPILDWVTTYGPPALALLLILGIVGLPVPDETLLVFSGYLIQQGTFSASKTWIAAALGSITGITISYLLGRTLGYQLIVKYGTRFGVTEKRYNKVHEWFQGVGHWGLTFGYFIPGVRHFTALVAGSTKLEYPTFAAYAYSGGIFWVSLFLGLGYIIGEQWRNAAEHAHQLLLVAALIGGVGLGIYFWRRKRNKKGL